MRQNKIYFILFFLLSIINVHASKNPKNNTKLWSKSKIIAYGKQQLKDIILQNEINEQEGLCSSNQYVFYTKNTDLSVNEVKQYVWGENFEDKQHQLDELNAKLIEINQDLVAPLYLGVNLDMGRVYLKNKITGYSTVNTIKDIQEEEKEKDLDKLLVQPVNNLYNQINNAISSSLANKPITINTIGFFQISYSKGDLNKVYLKTWLRQIMAMRNFHEDPEKSKQKASVIKQALRKTKSHISINSSKNIDLPASKDFFERYKAAINNYWDADLNQYNFKYAFNANSVIDWYNKELKEKEKADFKPDGEQKVYDYTGLFFDFKGKVASHLNKFKNTSGDDIRVVITDDFTDLGKQKLIESILKGSNYKNSVIWIHISKDNYTVKQSIFKNGFEIQLDPILEQRLLNFGNNIFSGGFSPEKTLTLLVEIDAIITELGRLVFSNLGDVTQSIRIPKELWDSASENYFFKDLNVLVSENNVLEPIVTDLQNTVALISGFYNGIVDTVGVLTTIGESAFDIKAFVTKMFNDAGYRNSVLAQCNETIAVFKDEEKRNYFISYSTELFMGNIQKSWNTEWDKYKSGDKTSAYYFSGNISFEVIAAVLTMGGTAAATAGKGFIKTLKWLLDPLEFIFKAGKKFITPVTKLMKKGFKVATDGVVTFGQKAFFKIDISNNTIVLFGKLGTEILQTIDNGFNSIVEFTLPDGFLLKIKESGEELKNKVVKIVKGSNDKYKLFIDDLANAGANLAEYVNIRKYLGDGRVTVYLTGAEQKAFQEILKTGDPEVLKWINKMTDAEVDDFAEMVRGYKDNPNKFKDAIKSIDNFLGDGVNDGFMTYWTLTPKMKNGLSTVRTLKQEGKLLPTGNATEVHLATVQNYTAWGNFLNVPMRYNGHFGKYATRALKHMKEALSELRKVPQRNKAGDIVYSGRAYSQDDFKKLFVGNKGEEVPINKGFVSSSTDEKVAAHFANYKTSSSTNNVKVIRRIETKTGVYVDDLSDYGVNLGKTRHTNAPPIEQVQKEVLMEEGLFKQLSEPIPFTGPDGGTWYYIDFVELGKPLK